MNLYMNKNENALWGSVLFLAILALFLSIKYLELLIFWIIVLLFEGNAKRIHSNKYPIFTTVLRRSAYIIPLCVPLFLHLDPSLLRINILWIVIGVCTGILFVLPKFSMWRIALSNDYLLFTATRDKFLHIMAIYTVVGAAISEELFFRYYILKLHDEDLLVLLNLFISAVYFMLLHYGTKWANEFSKYDFIVQVLFGFVSAILFLFSNSIIPSIIAHLVYNSPHVIKSVKSWLLVRGKETAIES
ncbi:CPBP family intramembrane glutamic endopeptidase [Caldifermentibacillus hisashii]|uniref:CPBP family intramembrane glutamic endopeptidase n=1 Tax=Caldifermentibacillus hisashii TaxID=996558 RepID=UPI0031FC3FFE